MGVVGRMGGATTVLGFILPRGGCIQLYAYQTFGSTIGFASRNRCPTIGTLPSTIVSLLLVLPQYP